MRSPWASSGSSAPVTSLLAAVPLAANAQALGGAVAASYATQAWVTSQGYITGITGALVTTALGYTPYNGTTNPNGFINGSGNTSGSSGSCTGTATNATNLTGTTQSAAVTWSAAQTFGSNIVAAGGNTATPGSISSQAATGLNMQAKSGTTYDWGLTNPTWSAWIMYVPHGTNNMGFGGSIAVNGVTPVSKPTITGSKGGNAALASLLTALAAMGFFIDSTT